MSKDPTSEIQGCSKCVYLVDINCHPWNDKVGRGTVLTKMGNGCLIALSETFRGKGSESITYFDSQGGSCELFTDKSTSELVVSVEEKLKNTVVNCVRPAGPPVSLILGKESSGIHPVSNDHYIR